MKQGLICAVALGLAGCAATAAPVLPASVSTAEAASIDAALDAVYAVISGPAGQARDWTRMRGLFTPDARLTAITSKGLRGGSVEDYIRTSGPLLTSSGFTESQLGRRIEVYGNLAHAWSSYAGTSSDGKVNVRGINSFQLVRQADGSWKVYSILWQPESPALPLPADMVGGR